MIIRQTVFVDKTEIIFMKVTFIRHYKLAQPLDKKETISPEQYRQLSKGEIDPSINSDIDDFFKINCDYILELHDSELILTSPSNRTKESAQEIIKRLNKHVDVKETVLLKECVWNPELQGSRVQRFIDNIDLTNLEETWKRIQALEKYIKILPYNNILCVTHSFFMQILYLYFSGRYNSWETIKEEDIKNSFHGDYLKGFTVNI